MKIIASMFSTRLRAEDAIERLLAARCPRDAITFLPENELSEVASGGAYDWRKDRWGLWRGLATFEVMSHADRYSLVEGMVRGTSVLLVAAKNEDDAEHYGTILVEAGAIDLTSLNRGGEQKGGRDSMVKPGRCRVRLAPKRIRRSCAFSSTCVADVVETSAGRGSPRRSVSIAFHQSVM